MAVVLVIQHGPVQTPGRIGRVLRDHGFTLDVRRPDLDAAALPPDLDEYHAVVSLGGPQNVGDNPAWMTRELDLLREGVDRDLAVIGVCLGHQLLAKALGGSVEPMEAPEIGYHTVQAQFPGYTETLLTGVPWAPTVFSSHGWHVTKAPAGAQVLQTSGASPVQAMRVGMRSIGFSYHLEADAALARAIAEQASDLRDRAGVSLEDIDRQAEAGAPAFERMAQRICVNLATLAFPHAELMGRLV